MKADVNNAVVLVISISSKITLQAGDCSAHQSPSQCQE